MAVLFLPTLTLADTSVDFRGIELTWNPTYETLAETYHVYRNTTDVFPEPHADEAIINATQYIDLPTATGTYYYWIAYITLNNDHVVFARSAPATIDRNRFNPVNIVKLLPETFVELSARTNQLGDIAMVVGAGGGGGGVTTFTDNSGYNKTLAHTGNTVLSPTQKKFGDSSIYFDGTGDYLTATNDASLKFNSSNWTIEFWAYTLGTAGGTVAGRFTLANRDFAIQQTTGGQWIFAVGTGSGSWDIAADIPAGAYTVNGWQHIALVRNGTAYNAYVNGVGTNIAMSAGYIGYNSAVPFQFGGNSSVGTYWAGYLDEIRVSNGIARYTANFTPAVAAFADADLVTEDPFFSNVLTLLHGDGINGSTTFTNNGYAGSWTPSGNVQITTAEKKYGSGSILFDGSGDYLTSAISYHNLEGAPFTIELWVKFTSLIGQRTIISNYQSPTVGYTLQTVGDVLYFNAKGDPISIQSPAGALTGGQWYHIAISGWAGGTSSQIKMFINGVQTGSTFTGATYMASATNLSIGTLPGYALYFSGYMDDVRITSGYSRYNENFTPPAQAHPNVITADSNYQFNSLLLHGDGGAGGGGSVIAPVYYDGTDWRYFADNTLVS